jgi:hypothetical protein
MCSRIAYLSLAAGEAVGARKVSRFLEPTALLAATYHPVLDRGAIAACHPQDYQLENQLWNVDVNVGQQCQAQSLE